MALHRIIYPCGKEGDDLKLTVHQYWGREGMSTKTPHCQKPMLGKADLNPTDYQCCKRGDLDPISPQCWKREEVSTLLTAKAGEGRILTALTTNVVGD